MDKNRTLSGLTYLFTNLSERYCKHYHISMDAFFELDKKYGIFAYIEECDYFFNDNTWLEGVKAIHNYINKTERCAV